LGAVTLGAKGDRTDYYLLGDIAEVVVYNAALSDTDRQTVEGYLAWRWGLQGSLPAGHPYKNCAPPGPCASGAKRRILSSALEPFDLNALSPWSISWMVGKLKGIWWEIATPFIYSRQNDNRDDPKLLWCP
jgi:hypothetical protein